MSTKKLKPGRPPVDSELLRARMERELIDGIETFAAEQPDKPGRSEAIRRIVRDWLIGNGYLRSD